MIFGGVCGGAWVNAIKRGHTHELSQETKDLQETPDLPRFEGEVQDDEYDVKMLFSACPLLKV